ncbi:MAG: hypothetical protein AB2L20_07245 [Mangrovibacterium sp.]
MNSSSLFKVLFLLLSSITIVSCNKNDDGPNPVPPVPSYETSFDISLGYTFKVTDTETKQVLVEVDYGVADVNTLVYVIHRESDGRYLKLCKMGASSVKSITTNNIAVVTDSLPEGKYYITFVAFKDFAVKGVDIPVFFESLIKNYHEAVMQIPNDYVHYATTEFEVSAIDGANKSISMDLKKMTTDLIFEFIDANKIPDPYNHQLTVGMENVPSAFFIANGKTLSPKETEENKLYLYSGEQSVSLLTSEGHKAVVTTFHSLSNDNLHPSDRGKYWFEFKENVDGGKQIKAVSEELGEFSASLSSSMYAYGLYDEKQALVKSIRKTE